MTVSLKGDEDGGGHDETRLPLQERRRNLEILKYGHLLRTNTDSFVPDVETSHESEQSAPKLAANATLTAFAQLATLRMNTKRGFICLVDGLQLHILAEGTRSVSPFDVSQCEPGDSILLGVQSIPYKDTITSRTLPAYDGHEDHWFSSGASLVNGSRCVITNLQAEGRVEDLQFIKDNSSSRFYAEVPMRNPSGVIVGILGVLDDQPRSDPTSIDVDPLQDVARLAVEHLELIRLRDISMRAERLMQGLGRFNSGYSNISHQSDRPNQPAIMATSPLVDQEAFTVFRSGPQDLAGRLPLSSQQEEIAAPSTAESGLHLIDSQQTQAVGTVTDTEIRMEQLFDQLTSPPATETSVADLPSDIKHVFHRASNILLESMKLDACCFMELPAKSYAGTDTRDPTVGSTTSRPTSPGGRAPLADFSESSSSSNNDPKHLDAAAVDKSQPKRSSYKKAKGISCTQLSASTRETPTQATAISHNTKFVLPQRVLRQLVFLYPAGHVFNFDAHSAIPSEDESSVSSRLPHMWRKVTSIIAGVFPDAISLIFVPLYDDRQTPYAGFFGWTMDSFRVLGPNELIFISGFANSVMCEIARLEVLALDKAKSDFMSSISHELRSPLHGILAATQLIQESQLSSDQSELAIMVDGCGRTLLDILNNLLEHSRINNLIDKRRGSRNSKKAKSSDRISKGSLNTVAPVTSDPPSSVTNIATVLEETISSVHAGILIQDKSVIQVSIDEHSGTNETAAHTVETSGDLPDQISYHPIVVVDIECRDSWMCQIDAGSWRRVAMNLIGNALKYTEKGYVYVALHASEAAPTGVGSGLIQVTLTVSDTGRGISDNYMTHSLYTAFSQEDNLSVGVGLGLSIVDRLVASMGGKINIDSEVNIGTNVSVTIPLKMEPRTAEPGLSSILAIEQFERATAGTNSVCLLGFDHENTSIFGPNETRDARSIGLMKLKKALSNCVQQWCNLSLTTNSSDAAVLIIEEFYAFTLVRSNPSSAVFTKPYILLNAWDQSFSSKIRWAGCHGRVAHPAGPTKLVRALANLLQQQKNNNLGFPHKFLLRNNSLTQDVTSPPDTSPDTMQLGSISAAQDTQPSTEYRLLLVEDNDINLRILTKLVRKLNFSFITATNGKEALDAYISSYEEGSPIRCIFMDISMPVMDGLESTRRIRAYEKEKSVSEPVEIIALTGLGRMETQDEAMASGVDMYYRKPVSLDIVREILKARKP